MTFLLNIILSFNLLIPLLGEQDSTVVRTAPKALQELLDNLTTKNNEENDVEIEIDGLLVDDTKTKIGRDFYDMFYSNWEAPANAKNYTITVKEKPFRMTSTFIEISINDNLVFQSVLQPRQNIVENLSQQAIVQTYNYLLNYEEIMKQLNGEDQAGTGIY
ncbi:CsgE family curli-type amyloid fiber assembly protein [Sunxiuqinia indica]|uniref:CsgE family curli-type amyloid fiber assembly protein n=1 Tax=Sunxiuqinia indica TaxID=2692584 RepID=UPI00135773B3|nr:CsgE family curli-type amyloid fiber assembly protein [Sunxiuqinia indica]